MAIQFPANPTNGQVYQGYYYDSNLSAWKASPVSAGPVAIADVAPTGAIHGDMWYNSLDGSSYIYVNDGTSSQWVEVHSNTAALPGSVIQVVQGRNNIQATMASATEVIGNQVTITPKLATSKILIHAYSPVRVWGAVINPWMGTSLWRNSTRILHDARNAANTYSAGLGMHVAVGTGTNYWGGHSNMIILDSPATTNAITYYVKFSAQTTSTTASYPHTESNNSADAGAVIIAMEVAQ